MKKIILIVSIFWMMLGVDNRTNNKEKFGMNENFINVSTENNTNKILLAKEKSVEKDEIDENELYSKYDEIIDRLNIEKLERNLKNAGISNKYDIHNLIKCIATGNGKQIWSSFILMIKDVFITELICNKDLMIQLIIIVLIGSIFTNLSIGFANGVISENGFYVTYMIITSILLISFSLALDIVANSIDKVTILIKIFIPVYALVMNYVGQIASATGMYEIVMVIIWLVQIVIIRVIMPMIKFYVIVSLVNNVNKDDSFSKLSLAIKKTINWILKTIIVFIVGINVVKSLINPQLDAIGRESIKRIVSTVPGGSIVSLLTGTFLGAGLVIKNSIGIVGIILIVGVVMLPIAKIFIMLIIVRITTVLVQPLGEKRYINGIETTANGLAMLLQSIGCSIVLFMLTIAFMAFNRGG